MNKDMSLSRHTYTFLYTSTIDIVDLYLTIVASEHVKYLTTFCRILCCSAPGGYYL